MTLNSIHSTFKIWDCNDNCNWLLNRLFLNILDLAALLKESDAHVKGSFICAQPPFHL